MVTTTHEYKSALVERVYFKIDGKMAGFDLVNWGDNVLLNSPDRRDDILPDGANCTINNVPYRASVILRFDGEWRIDPSYTYMSRPNSFSMHDGTVSARGKLHTYAAEFVAEYMTPERVKAGTLRRLEDNAWRAEQDVAKLAGELAEAQSKLDAIEREIEALV